MEAETFVFLYVSLSFVKLDSKQVNVFMIIFLIFLFLHIRGTLCFITRRGFIPTIALKTGKKRINDARYIIEIKSRNHFIVCRRKKIERQSYRSHLHFGMLISTTRKQNRRKGHRAAGLQCDNFPARSNACRFRMTRENDDLFWFRPVMGKAWPAGRIDEDAIICKTNERHRRKTLMCITGLDD